MSISRRKMFGFLAAAPVVGLGVGGSAPAVARVDNYWTLARCYTDEERAILARRGRPIVECRQPRRLKAGAKIAEGWSYVPGSPLEPIAS